MNLCGTPEVQGFDGKCGFSERNDCLIRDSCRSNFSYAAPVPAKSARGERSWLPAAVGDEVSRVVQDSCGGMVNLSTIGAYENKCLLACPSSIRSSRWLRFENHVQRSNLHNRQRYGINSCHRSSVARHLRLCLPRAKYRRRRPVEREHQHHTAAVHAYISTNRCGNSLNHFADRRGGFRSVSRLAIV